MNKKNNLIVIVLIFSVGFLVFSGIYLWQSNTQFQVNRDQAHSSSTTPSSVPQYQGKYIDVVGEEKYRQMRASPLLLIMPISNSNKDFSIRGTLAFVTETEVVVSQAREQINAVVKPTTLIYLTQDYNDYRVTDRSHTPIDISDLDKYINSQISLVAEKTSNNTYVAKLFYIYE